MRFDAAVPVLPLAGVVPFPQSPHPYLVSAPVGGAGGRAAAFYQPAFSPMADVGVIAEVLPCGEGGLLECTPLDRVRRMSDGALDVVADTPLDEAAAEEAARLHGELWTLLATLRGADAADGPLTSLRPGAASPSHASLVSCQVLRVRCNFATKTSCYRFFCSRGMHHNQRLYSLRPSDRPPARGGVAR